MTLQERILALAEKVKNPPSWWWKVLGGIIFFVMAVWISYLLSKRADALAELKTQAAKEKYDATKAETAASVERDISKRRDAELAAKVALANALKKQKDVETLEKEHKTAVAQLQAVKNKDWDALNKLAGVQP